MAILNLAIKEAGGKVGLVLINLNEVVGDINRTKELLERYAEQGVRDATQKLASLVQDKTPVDTGNLKASIDFVGIEKEGGKIIGVVSTGGVDYAEAVEFGVKGKQYNYHKGSERVYHSGVGAAMIRRTLDSPQDQAELERIIINAFQ